jgi:release factor glutamine methyltransferase
VKKNLDFLKLKPEKIQILKADFLNVFQEIKPANLIISNPPYIAKNDFHLEKSVSKFEPHQALFAKNEGLEFYQLMAEHYQEVVDLTKPFMIIMEFG